MLTVVMTSMPAASSSSMSCQRFSLRDPGTLVCASSSTSATFGRAGQDGVEVHLAELRAAVGTVRRGTTSSPSSSSAVCWRPWVSTKPTTTSVPRSAGGGPRRAWRTSCPLPARRRGRPGASPRSRAPRSPRSAGAACRSPAIVQRQVELQDVHAGLAEEAEAAASVCSSTSARTSAAVQAALARDPGDLLIGVLRADVRVEPGAAGAAARPGRPSAGSTPSSSAAAARRSSIGASRSSFSGPRLERR